jgi:hypothetical protein
MQVISGGSTMTDSENQFDESMAIQVQSIECDSQRLKEENNYNYIKKTTYQFCRGTFHLWLY